VCENRAPDVTLAELVRGYLDSQVRRGISPKYQALQNRLLSRFVEFLRGRARRQPIQLRPLDLAAFAEWASEQASPKKRRRGLSLHPMTVARWIRIVRRFCRWLVREEHLLLDPTVGLVPPRWVRSLPRVLTREETDRLLSAPAGDDCVDLRDRAILEVLYSSGLRASELVGLDVSDLDLTAGEVVIRCGKGGRARRVPVGPAAVRAVVAYLKKARESLLTGWRMREPQALFLSRHGSRLKTGRLLEIVHRRAHQAGLSPGVSPHSLRHTAAVDLLRGGADVRHVQELLGHVCVDTTTIYTRLVSADLRWTLDHAHPRARMKV